MKLGQKIKPGRRVNKKFLRFGIRYVDDPAEYRRLQSIETRQRDPLGCVFAAAKSRAKKFGLEFDLVKEELTLPEYCPVFGLKLGWTPGYRSDNSYSLDRWDNTKGYTKENSRIISWKANRLKRAMSFAEIEALYNYMKKE